MWPLCHWYCCRYDHRHAFSGTLKFFPGLWAAVSVVTGSEVEPLLSWMFCPLPGSGSCFPSHAFSSQTCATLHPKSPIRGLAVPAEWLRAADQRLSLHVSKVLFSHPSEFSIILRLACLPALRGFGYCLPHLSMWPSPTCYLSQHLDLFSAAAIWPQFGVCVMGSGDHNPSAICVPSAPSSTCTNSSLQSPITLWAFFSPLLFLWWVEESSSSHLIHTVAHAVDDPVLPRAACSSRPHLMPIGNLPSQRHNHPQSPAVTGGKPSH